MRDDSEISRRSLLKAAGGGIMLLVGFDLLKRVKADGAAPAPSPFKSWIESQQGIVTLLSGRSEMGQVFHALPMVLADELGVDWQAVRVEQAPNDMTLFGEQETGGSGSVAGSFMLMRQAAAAAKTMLVTAAAQRWNIAPDQCQVNDGVITHGGDRFTFGELVEAAAKLPVPDFNTVA